MFRSPCYSTDGRGASRNRDLRFGPVTTTAPRAPPTFPARSTSGSREAVEEGNGSIYQPATSRGGSASSRLGGPPFTPSTK